MENTLYYGDNLDVLRRHVPDESVDLVYLDPPFKSEQDYNVLFADQDGSRSAAQIRAFEDTWRWDRAAAAAFQEVVEAGGRASLAMQAFRRALGDNDLLAYLSMMAPRLKELHRVLKPTGSIYLHCDPAASHYLKMLMDAVFTPFGFLSEIVWKRTHAHGSSRRYAPVHDTICFYAKGEAYNWTGFRLPHSPEYVAQHFTSADTDGRRFQPISPPAPESEGARADSRGGEIDPTAVGRHWALPGEILERIGVLAGTVQEKLEALEAAHLIFWPKKQGGTPRLKWYADELAGSAMPDVWSDIPPISASRGGAAGIPDAKARGPSRTHPDGKQQRGRLVLDPFCGCGTAIAVAQRLHRRWIGIDVTHLAVSLIKHRLHDAFGEEVAKTYDVVGEPVDLPGARALAAQDAYQFQWWTLGLVGRGPSSRRRAPTRALTGAFSSTTMPSRRRRSRSCSPSNREAYRLPTCATCAESWNAKTPPSVC